MNLFRKAVLAALIFHSLSGRATVTLVERDGWKVDLGGFLALDMIRDSTQGQGEVLGNSAVARPGTFAGDNPRTQFSAKHTRVSFAVYGPQEDGWKNKGYLEGDFLGNQPSGGSEYSFYSNGTFRLRHAYLSTEKDGWKFLAGQASILFGFVPTYLLATVSVIPGPAQIYQRTAQVQALKSFELGADTQFDVAAAIARPTQEDSGIPNLDVGMKWMFKRWKARMALVSGEMKLEPASLALSGTFREFKTTDRTLSTQTSRTRSAAVAANLLLPLLLSDDLKAGGHSLLLTSTFTSGTGYADVLSGWTANLAKFPANASDQTHLDAGEGAFVAAGTGDFRLLPVQTWNAQLQYHLPAEWRSWFTAGYARLWSSGVGTMGPVATGKILYDGVGFWFLNATHDFTSRIRGALEYSRKTVHYVDSVRAANDRYQLCFLYRF